VSFKEACQSDTADAGNVIAVEALVWMDLHQKIEDDGSAGDERFE
jgi:hypothetical protein